MIVNDIRVAGVLTKGLRVLGDEMATEIENTALQVQADAIALQSKLNDLAAAIREHTKCAEDEVTAFVERSRTAMTNITNVCTQLRAKLPEQTPQEDEPYVPEREPEAAGSDV